MSLICTGLPLHREYNGEVRQRCNVTTMQRLDYAAEAGTMLQDIANMTAVAA